MSTQADYYTRTGKHLMEPARDGHSHHRVEKRGGEQAFSTKDGIGNRRPLLKAAHTCPRADSVEA